MGWVACGWVGGWVGGGGERRHAGNCSGGAADLESAARRSAVQAGRSPAGRCGRRGEGRDGRITSGDA